MDTKFYEGDIVYVKMFVKRSEKLITENEPRYYLGSLLGYDEVCLPESFILKKTGEINTEFVNTKTGEITKMLMRNPSKVGA